MVIQFDIVDNISDINHFKDHRNTVFKVIYAKYIRFEHYI